MSAKRTHHTKTRSGCDQCKKRHIKCDELGPPCANCRVRGLECGRNGIPRTPSASAPATGPSNVNITWSPSPESVSTVGGRTLELELMHMWTTETYKGFSLVDNDEYVWRVLVPRDALKYDFLLHALFGITALHLACTSGPTSTNVYETAALEYHNLAITTFQARAPGGSLSMENHQAIFTFSMLNLALGIALPYYAPLAGKSSVIENLVPTMFHLIKGTASIVMSARDWIAVGPWSGMLGRGNPAYSIDKLDSCLQNALQRLHQANHLGYVELSRAPPVSSSDAVKFHERNEHAIENLEQAFCTAEDLGQLVCMRWLARLDHGFIEALAALEPVALLVTMHWAILLDVYGDKWWAKGSGKLLITEMSVTLLKKRPDWEEAIGYVHDSVGLPRLRP